MLITPLLNQQQLPLPIAFSPLLPLLFTGFPHLALISLRPPRQRVPGQEHLGPGRARCLAPILSLLIVPVNTNHIHGLAVKCRVGKILDPVHGLRTGDAAGDDGDVVAAEAEGRFEVGGDVAEPVFAGGDGVDVGPGLVLNIDALIVDE